MDFSDEDVSASEDELQHDYDGSVDGDDGVPTPSDDEDNQEAADMTAAAQQAVPNTTAAGMRQETAVAAQDALMNGELSTNAALLQLQV